MTFVCPDGFQIARLAESHNRAAFECGVPELDRFLKEQAGQYSPTRKSIAATHVLTPVDNNQVVGYYSLVNAQIPLHDLPENIAKKVAKHELIPATLLARLAVDQQYKNRRLGEFLVLHALYTSHRCSLDVASFAVIVDAKSEGLADFYKRHGFVVFDDKPLRLFLTMKTITKLFETLDSK